MVKIGHADVDLPVEKSRNLGRIEELRILAGYLIFRSGLGI